jgi:ankyrin repeat protein
MAALGGHGEAAAFLLQKGAWAEAYDAEDNTPLHLAARWVVPGSAAAQQAGQPWCRAALARRCIHVSYPLICARHGHTGVMEVLVQQGAKAGAENKQGLTAAACALVGGHVAAAKLLQG